MTFEVLAIDLGTTSGWATRTDSGTACFKLHRPSGEIVDDDAKVLDLFSSWLSNMIDVYQPSILVLEKNPALSKIATAAPRLLGLRAVALVVGYRRQLLLQEIPSRGRRDADKSDENDAKSIRDRWIANSEHRVREED